VPRRLESHKTGQDGCHGYIRPLFCARDAARVPVLQVLPCTLRYFPFRCLARVGLRHGLQAAACLCETIVTSCHGGACSAGRPTAFSLTMQGQKATYSSTMSQHIRDARGVGDRSLFGVGQVFCACTTPCARWGQGEKCARDLIGDVSRLGRGLRMRARKKKRSTKKEKSGLAESAALSSFSRSLHGLRKLSTFRDRWRQIVGRRV